MNSTPKVSDIFKAAGEAFNRLGELTMQLQSREKIGKWSDEDVDMLQTAITNFGEDLNKISVRVKNRTASQIRQTLTKQAFEEAGIKVQQVNVPQLPNSGASGSQQQPLTVLQESNGTDQFPASSSGDHLIGQSSPSSEVMMTLNRLNANAQEDDLEFGVEVATG